jgi:uncharacterized protein YdcH (DUF465 family)
MTFGNLIDEGYDDILDDQARFAKLIEVINNISKKTKEELDEISRRAEEITEFNFNRLALRGELARHELIEKFVDIFRD